MTDPAQVADTTPAAGSFYAAQDNAQDNAQPDPDPAAAAPAAATTGLAGGVLPAPAAPPAAADPEVDAAARPTPDEVFDTLNHFDELAIKRAFREPVTALDDMGGGRAMWFTLLRRSGVDDQTALDTVLKAPWRDVKANFRSTDSAGQDEDEATRPEA